MKITLTSLMLVISILSSCVVYKLDVQQGNEITAEMMSQLEIGMTKREVTRVLGSPLIKDPFHKDRWDYFYSKKEGATGNTVRQSVAIIFSDDILIEIRTSSAN